MKLEEINKKLDEARLTEEEAVPIYTEHISATAFWAGLSSESIKKIQDYLQILHDDSLGHAKVLAIVKKIINKQKK